MSEKHFSCAMSRRVNLQQWFQSGVNVSDVVVVMRTREGKYLDSKNLGHSPQAREMTKVDPKAGSGRATHLAATRTPIP